MAKIAFWSSRCETEKKMSLFKAILQSASKVRRLIKISAFHHKKLPSCGPIFFFTKKGQKSCILKVIFHSNDSNCPIIWNPSRRHVQSTSFLIRKCHCSFYTFQITLLFMFHSKKLN